MNLHCGDCLEVLGALPENSVDAVVTDPPYGLAFMGKSWDYTIPSVEHWAACLRVLKPGAPLLSFAGTRTQHRMACAIEDAGFEIRDLIAWLYGSGFPKSVNVSKEIDKHLGAVREKVRIPSAAVRNQKASGGGRDGVQGASRPFIEAAMERGYHEVDGDEAVTDAAAEWDGWGTALKPAMEPITLARKPLNGTIPVNILKYGVGALNIGGCRVEPTGDSRPRDGEASQFNRMGGDAPSDFSMTRGRWRNGAPEGRWPANVIHDGSNEVLACFPDSKGQQGDLKGTEPSRTGDANTYGQYGPRPAISKRGDSGSAARFFYCAKASQSERGEENTHPTVKPIALMTYLVNLVSRPGSTVLDPFMGSGTTGVACALSGRAFIGIERQLAYFNIAQARIAEAIEQPSQLDLEVFLA